MYGECEHKFLVAEQIVRRDVKTRRILEIEEVKYCHYCGKIIETIFKNNLKD